MNYLTLGQVILLAEFDDAVEKIISVASGSVETKELASWINQYLREKE